MRVLILGATGMLGQAIVREASNRKIDVIGAARSGTDISLEITDDRSLKYVIEHVRPTIIINAVALVSLLNCEQNPCFAYLVNARPVGLLAEISHKIGAYLIQISTDHYFTNDRDFKHPETSSVRLLNEYARTKYAGEKFALTCPGALVIRTNIVGFRRKNKKEQPTFVEWVIQTLEKGLPITLFNDFYTSSIHVKQFSSVLFDLFDKRPEGVLNVASRDVSNKKTFIEAIASRLGYSLSNTTLGSVLKLTDVPRAESLGLDVTRAEQILGYNLPAMNEVVDSLICEYKEISQ